MVTGDHAPHQSQTITFVHDGKTDIITDDDGKVQYKTINNGKPPSLLHFLLSQLFMSMHVLHCILCAQEVLSDCHLHTHPCMCASRKLAALSGCGRCTC